MMLRLELKLLEFFKKMARYYHKISKIIIKKIILLEKS